MPTTPSSPVRSARLTARRCFVGAAVATAVAGLVAPAVASAAPAATSYRFATHDDHADPTFNQLLGINGHGQVAGYFGSGLSGHPNVGYLLNAPYGQGDYHVRDFPGAVQTQDVAINDSGTLGGFYADAAGDNFGFVNRGGIYTVVIDPHTTGTVNQVLGVNNHGLAAGFYTDAKGTAHGYLFDFHRDTFRGVGVPGAGAVTASGVNDNGDVTGFYTDAKGDTRAFLRLHSGRLVTFTAPGSTNTTAFGVNDHDEVVGSYTIGTKSYGFTWRAGALQTVSDPNGVGTTIINGVNGAGDLVGFYVDGAGNTDGFVGVPK